MPETHSATATGASTNRSGFQHSAPNSAAEPEAARKRALSGADQEAKKVKKKNQKSRKSKGMFIYLRYN